MKPSEPNLSREEFTELLEKVHSITDAVDDAVDDAVEQAKESVKPVVDTIDYLKDYFNTLQEASVFVKELCPDYTNREVTVSAITFVAQYRALTTEQKSQFYSFQDFLTQERTEILEAAHAFMQSADEDIDSITTKDIEELDFPLDKVNWKIWNLSDAKEKEQIKIAMESEEDKRKGKELNVYYSFDFDKVGEEICAVKRLNTYDKRVYIAVSGIFNAGYNAATLTKIYNAMGYKGRPGKTDLEKIDNSLTKMSLIYIEVDNKEEAKVYNYPEFSYKGVILPIERYEKKINGNILDSVVHFFREPPLLSFAKGRKQVTKIRINVLQSPLNKSESNLILEDYLLSRIARAKNGKGKSKIRYEKIYENISFDKNKSKAIPRLHDKITKLFDYYVDIGFISGYTTDTTGISVSFTKKSKQKGENKN